MGSGDSAREGLPLDEADAAPPSMRNGTQERFGVVPGSVWCGNG